MITRIVKFNVKKSSIDSFGNLLKEIRSEVLAFKGCKYFDLLNDKNNKNIFFSYSIWESEYYHDQYVNSGFFKTIWEQVVMFLESDAQVHTVENFFDNIIPGNELKEL